VTARRVRQLLTAPRLAASQLPAAGVAPRRAGRRWHQVIASALVPGLGQLLQDRFASGAVLLTAAGLLFVGVLGPMLWASSGPKMDVALSTRFTSVLWWLLLAGAAAADAWHFSAAQRRRART
jgi:hypothetical protein